MAAYNFPDAPTVGQTFAGLYQYTWDGEKWTMGTGSPVVPPVDTTAPTAVSYSPSNNAVGISVAANMVVTFSEPVAFGTGNFTLKKSVDDSVVDTFNVVTEVGTGAGQISLAGAIVTMHLTTNMLGTTGYYVTIDPTAIDDLVGNSFVGISLKTVWHWTTSSADVTAPTIVSLSPADGNLVVALNSNFVITFNETVVAGTTASFRLYKTLGDVLVETLTQTDFGTKVTIAGAAVTINWTSNLNYSTAYYVKIDAGSVKDNAGNAFAGITNATTWNVNSILEAPTLVLNSGDDTGTPGDDSTETENPDLDIDFGSVTIEENGKLYIKVDGVVENIGGIGYHLITAPEAAGGDITLTGMTSLTPGVYDLEAKYEAPDGRTSNYGAVYELTITALSGNGLLTNLVSYWKLDEASGNATDAHGTNTLTDGSTFVGTGTGIINGARDFERSIPDYLTHADNTDLSTGNIDFSFSVWLKFESQTAHATILGKWTGTVEYLLFYNQTSDRLEFFVSPDGTFTGLGTITASTFGAVPTGSWMHVVFAHDATNNLLKMYVNGVAETPVAYSAGVFDGAVAFRVGWADNADNTTGFDGLIDELGFWKRVLSPTDVATLYASGAGFPYGSFS